MIPQYKPEFFKIEELVPRITFENNREAVLWNVFDHRILITADMLRNRYRKLLANTWAFGGQHQYRGYRPSGCLIGSTHSQHRFGRALDLEPVFTTAEEIRQDILREPNRAEFKYITAMELNVPWLHIDCRSHSKAVHGILTFKP